MPTPLIAKIFRLLQHNPVRCLSALFHQPLLSRKRVKTGGGFSAILLGGVIFLAAGAVTASTLDSLEQTRFPETFDHQSGLLKLINGRLQNSHYRPLELDDHFSAKVLDRYINSLDPGKTFFLQRDIDYFLTLQYEFDDYIRQGNLAPIYAIFSVFRTRVNQQIQFALDRLQQPFSFAEDEVIDIDRSDNDWAATNKGLDNYWRKRIKNDIINLRLAGKAEDEIIETLERRYIHITRRTRQLKPDDVFQNFINAYMGAIEPHTSYYSPRGAENFKIHMRLSLEGIGAVLQTDNEFTLVRRIIPGGPADLAGELKADDRIVGVGQEDEEVVDVIGWRLDDVVDLIRGPQSSTVKLEILPGESGLEGETNVIMIVRDKVKLEEQAASKRILEIEQDGQDVKVGVIKLPSFYRDTDDQNTRSDFRSTTRDVSRLINELKQENIGGLIIDLRGNRGGFLTEAISLTGLFIEKGPVVQVQTSTGRTQVDRDQDPLLAYDGSLLVLVDRFSASASEIFAGAIQDYGRGLIVGEPTFGKGTVQSLDSLDRWVRSKQPLGEIKVTIAQFFRINGDSTQHRGVVPDIAWDFQVPDDRTGERAFENALPWRSIQAVRFQPFEPGINSQAVAFAEHQHLLRARVNPRFKYLKDLNDLNKRIRQEDLLPLAEDKRKAFRSQREQNRLDVENSLLAALGAPKADSLEAASQYHVGIGDQQENVDDHIADALLIESGHILVDYTQKANLRIGKFDKSLVNQSTDQADDTQSN